MANQKSSRTSYRIITIGRQFGAGGRTVGKMVAEQLGIDFYDKELIVEAAKTSGLPDQLLDHMDEQHTASLLYSLVMNAQVPKLFAAGKPIELLAYDAQIASVKAVAAKGPCVIVGRAADCILRDAYDVVSVFLTAPLPDRIHHVIQRDAVSEKEASQKIARLDKARASFYNSFSERKWGDASNYDLCLNASCIGMSDCAGMILHFLKHVKSAK
ncbi:MAG: cytidylate kinase [Collinsella tanakaei]|nr:MAG: cytidylate kinase [Collinsella tanakaei]